MGAFLIFLGSALVIALAGLIIIWIAGQLFSLLSVEHEITKKIIEKVRRKNDER